MKKIYWNIVDSKGKDLESYPNRASARGAIKWYKENVFQEWMDDINYPVKIVREQWELIDRKVVR